METSINRLTIAMARLNGCTGRGYRRHELPCFCPRFGGRIVRRCNVHIGFRCLDPSGVVAHNVTVRETAESVDFTENFVALGGFQTDLLNLEEVNADPACGRTWYIPAYILESILFLALTTDPKAPLPRSSSSSQSSFQRLACFVFIAIRK